MQVSIHDFSDVPVPTDEEFYAAWLPKAVGMARNLRLADPEAAAQDVVVDFVLSGYKLRWNPDAGRSFSTFAFWMLRRRLYSKLRTQKRYEARQLPTGLLPDLDDHDKASIEPGYEQAEATVDMAALADQIGGRQGEILTVLVEAAFEGASQHNKDIADELHCSGTTVQTHRAALRRRLEGQVVTRELLGID